MKKIILSIFFFGALLSASAQVPNYVPSNGLVGWWPFNGNANDESVNGNKGNVNGPILTTDRFGNSNKAYSFDGVNDNINPLQNNLPFGTTARTISVWFKSIGSGGCLFSYGSAKTSNAYMISIGANIIANQGWTSPDFPVYPSIDNSWHNVVCTFDGLNSTIYLDNKNLGSNPMTGLNTIAGSFYFGTRVLNDRDFFNGTIDDIGVWSRVLSSNEITLLFKGCDKKITKQPTNQGMFSGNATFTFATNDTLVNYQWQTNSGTGWNNLFDAGQYSGSSSNSLIVSNVTLSNNNQLFRCIIKGDCLADTTNEASLFVWGLGVKSEHIKPFKVYPNPTKGQVTIENGDIAKMIGYSITIYNAVGQELFQSNINQRQFSIDISQLGGNGLYFMELRDNNCNIVDIKKIVLQ